MADDDKGLTLWQRRQLKSLVKHVRKQPGERLGPEDWRAYFEWGAQPMNRVGKRMLRALPSTPRCGFCGAPFGGIGGRVVAPLGFRPSRKNPNVCAVCVELSPPGGMTAETGVLFADLRGFTARSESLSPAETSQLLRRFYAAAEHVLLPEALIDKFIGDEVMALYIPEFVQHMGSSDVEHGAAAVATVMVEHARALLRQVGYGSAEGPAYELGIGIDFGEAFIGNVGEGAVHDFTAVGDVVNTASRLTGQAGGGEIVVSARLAEHLGEQLGPLEELALKGKEQPVGAYRIRWSG